MSTYIARSKYNYKKVVEWHGLPAKGIVTNGNVNQRHE